MRYIRKGREPRELVEHRLTPDATYDNLPLPAKNVLRQRLAEEQGFLCCYCMQRISKDAMKIEHWAPQSDVTGRQLQLDWANLLGACLGGMGKPWAAQHCDTRKGDTALKIKPTEPDCERRVRFLVDGSVSSDDPAVLQDLDQTLNLNHAVLKNNRRKTLDAFRDFMARTYSGDWSKALLEKELEKLQEQGADGLLPYCQVAIYWLKKQMKSVKR